MAEYLSILETRRANIESDSVDNDYAQRTSRRYNKINEGRLDKDTLSFMSQFEDDEPAKPTSAPTTKSRPKDAYAGQSISTPTDAQDGNPFTRVFGPMLRESKAKSANIYALSKMYNVAPSEVQKGYSSYVEKTGLATQPTTTEFAKTIGKAAMVPLVATAAVANPAAAALAAGGFAAVDEIENFVISKIKDEDYKFLGGKSLSSLLPDEYNQSVKDVVDITEFMGKMYGAARFAPGAAREATKAFDKVTKDIITTYNVPDKVFVNAEKVKSIFQSGENISTQEAELVKSLGLTGPQYRQAIKDGVEIEIPLTKLTKVVDKPYWGKLKEAVGLKPYEKVKATAAGKPTSEATLKIEGPKATTEPAAGGVKTEELIGQAEERVRMWSEAEAGVEDQASEALSQLGITPTESVLSKPVDITPITGNPRVNIVDFYKPDIEPTVPGEPASALPKYAVNVNLNRIASTDDIRAAIMETSERFKLQMEDVRGPIATHEETKALANDLGMSVESLLNRRKGDPFTPESITASREILSSATKSIIMLRDVASRPDATKIDKLAYRKAIATHAAIQAQVTGLAAEAARSLNAFAINVDPNANPELMAKQLLEAYDRAGGDEITDQMLEDMKFLEYPDQINTYVRNAYKATGMDMLLSLRYFSMLSRPATHAVNVTSNAIFSLWQIPERYLSATFGKVLPGDDHMAFAEANQYAFGLVEGVKNGVILAGKALKGEQVSITGKQDFQDTKAITAENVASAFKSVERLNEALPKVGNYLGMGINMLGSLVDVPTRALQVEDAFFKGTASSMYLASESMRVAMSEGLSGTVMAARIEELRSNPTAEMLDAASKYADMLTFTDRADTAIAKGFRTFTRTFPAFKFIMPFQNTPINIFYRSMERTPVLNVLVKSWRSEMSRGGRDRDLALAKLSLGSMLTAAVWSMCDDGSITGGGPSDRKLASTKRLTGWQPYSYKVGDKYHSFNRLDPIASIVGIVADFHEIHGQSQESYKDESDSVAANMVMAMVKNYSSKTYMSGLTNFFEMMSDPERYGQQYIDQFAASFFPGIVASVEKVVDPTVRDVRTSEADSVANPDIMSAMHNEVRSTLNTLRSRIPGYSKDLPPKRNVWGDPIVLTGTFTEEMVSPIYTTSDKKDPASDEVFRLRIPLSTPMRSIRNIDLTPQQYSRYTELAGNAAKDDNDMGFHDNINALIKTREYKDASDELKIEYIKSYQNAFRKLAQNKMIEEYPVLLTKIEASVTARYDSLAE